MCRIFFVQKKLLKKPDRNMHFFTFTHVCQFVLLISFLCEFYETFSTDFKSAWNSALNDTHIEFFFKKFWGPFFAILTLKPNMKETAKKNKYVYYKYVLEIILATFNGQNKSFHVLCLMFSREMLSQNTYRTSESFKMLWNRVASNSPFLSFWLATPAL